MKTRMAEVISIVVFVAGAAFGSILGGNELRVDFTDANDAGEKALWSEPDKLTITKEGLGWDGEGNALRDGWIQSKPLAIGLSWRPPSAVNVRVTVRPLPSEFVINSGQKSTPDRGSVYVRYSADMKHWSSWQVLQRAEPQSVEEKKNPGRHFQGMIMIPNRERAEYQELLTVYSRLDVPWKSDEDAAARWIAGKNPDFFSEHIPLIGYVEFLFEQGFYGGQRIRSFEAYIGWAVGGKASPPKDKDAYGYMGDKPWRFRIEDDGIGLKGSKK